MKRIALFLFIIGAAAAFTGCNSHEAKQAETTQSIVSEQTRIVSLSGTTTEILCALGFEKNIVGVDMTSTYPASVAALPKVGHNRNMSAEAIIGLKPDIVIGIKENVNPELVQQLQAANAKVLLFSLESSVEGAKSLIAAVADTFGVPEKAEAVQKQIDQDLTQKVVLTTKPKVLFIYARGAGTVMAAGQKTYPTSMIALAGAENAVNDFEDFKPVTSESLVAANPDVVLMFDSGLESLGGIKGLLQLQGMAQTNAGKNKRVIEMDGQFLTAFGPRTGKAIAELSKKLNEVQVP